MFYRSLVLAGAIALAPAVTAQAATQTFHATLNGAQEVPPTTATATGSATATLDTATHELAIDVTFSGFTADVTAAHIHGPAEPGKNSGVVVPLGNAPTSPIHATAKLTEEQEKQLAAGQMYVNIHSKDNPSGAIRGQLTVSK